MRFPDAAPAAAACAAAATAASSIRDHSSAAAPAQHQKGTDCFRSFTLASVDMMHAHEVARARTRLPAGGMHSSAPRLLHAQTSWVCSNSTPCAGRATVAGTCGCPLAPCPSCCLTRGTDAGAHRRASALADAVQSGLRAVRSLSLSVCGRISRIGFRHARRMTNGIQHAGRTLHGRRNRFQHVSTWLLTPRCGTAGRLCGASRKSPIVYIIGGGRSALPAFAAGCSGVSGVSTMQMAVPRNLRAQ